MVASFFQLGLPNGLTQQSFLIKKNKLNNLVFYLHMLKTLLEPKNIFKSNWLWYNRLSSTFNEKFKGQQVLFSCSMDPRERVGDARLPFPTNNCV